MVFHRLCSIYCLGGFGLWGVRVVVLILCVADERSHSSVMKAALNMARLFCLNRRKLKHRLAAHCVSVNMTGMSEIPAAICLDFSVEHSKDELPKIFPCAAELFKAKRCHSFAELGPFTEKTPLSDTRPSSQGELVSFWCCSAVQ